MKNCCLKLIAGAGYVGCAKYAKIGGKGGYVGVVTKENQICKWGFSLDLCISTLVCYWFPGYKYMVT
jgi:hypothetical protein